MNDNQPAFTESKYVFNIKETVEFDEFYVSFNNDFEYYANLLEQTCLLLKNRIKVTALDNDYGFNSLIKYKIVQHVDRKNFQTSYLSQHPFNSVNLKSKYLGAYSLHRQQHDSASVYTRSRSSHLSEDSFFYIDETDGTVSLAACVMPIYAKNLTRDKFLEITNLLDYESFSKHLLLVEARDSNPYNSLQSVVTLEINLLDVNDNPPLLTGIFREKCSKANYHPTTSESFETSKMDFKAPNVSINYYNVDFDEFHSEKKSTGNFSYSTLIVIDDLSEWSRVGDCIGQFSIRDLDTANQNQRIDVSIVDSADLFEITKLNDQNGNNIRVLL